MTSIGTIVLYAVVGFLNGLLLQTEGLLIKPPLIKPIKPQFNKPPLLPPPTPPSPPSSETELPPSNWETLRLISVITRHGSRSPYFTYPNDPYPPYDLQYWPEGPEGQLTKYGKQQLYRTGLRIRTRYRGFLSEYYNYNETYVTTNHYDRDFMSASCLLAGLYPPMGYELWNPNILWQPIPIWYSFDLTSNATLCPRYTAEMNMAMANQQQQYASKFQRLFDTFTKYSGTNVTTFFQILGFYDNFRMQYENGFSLPDWTSQVYPEPTTSIAAVTFQVECTGTPEATRLISSPVLAMVYEQINNKINSTNSDQKIYIDAAHDATIVAIFNALGFTEPFYPRTSSYIVFELHEDPINGYFVKFLFFEDSAAKIPFELDAPACPNPCLLSTFNQFIDNFVPSDWTAECQTTAS